jgi:hypothetical protein
MRRLVPVLAGVTVAVALLLAVVAARGGDERPAPRAAATTFTARDGAYSIAAPRGWKAVAEGPAATVLRRDDRRGVVVIRRRPPLQRSSRSLTRDLTAQLGRRFEGLQPVGARSLGLASGPVYVYTFARPSAGTVQSIAVAPRRSGTYTIDAVAAAGARDAAAQIGAIVRSFDTTDPVPSS